MTSIAFSQITVHQTKDRESRLTLGISRSDPVVVFRLGGAEVATPPAEEAGKVARWGNVTLRNANLSSANELHVIVKDKNTLRPDTHIGEGTLPLQRLQDGQTQVVQLRTRGGGDAGELEFVVDSQGGFRSGQQGASQGVTQGATTGGGYATGTRSTTTTTTTGYTGGAATTGQATGGQRLGEVREYEGDLVCEVQTTSTIEDRPVTREVVERVVEHRPVQKEFVVETRPVGERELLDQRTVEVLGTTERIVRVTPSSDACVGAPTLEGIQGTGVHTGGAHHHRHHHHGPGAAGTTGTGTTKTETVRA